MPLLEETPLSDGLTSAQQERNRISAEVTAFEEFTDRLATVTPQQSPSTPTSGLVHARSGDTDAYDAIWTAYQDTVLTVEHWTEAYGETTIADSLQNEFSTGLAETLTAESRPPFSPTIQTRLQTEVENATRTRTQALEWLQTEVQQLRYLRDRLDDLIDDVRPVKHGNEPFDHRVQRLAAVSQSLEEFSHC